jgi:hypothetical protein
MPKVELIPNYPAMFILASIYRMMISTVHPVEIFSV